MVAVLDLPQARHLSLGQRIETEVVCTLSGAGKTKMSADLGKRCVTDSWEPSHQFTYLYLLLRENEEGRSQLTISRNLHRSSYWAIFLFPILSVNFMCLYVLPECVNTTCIAVPTERPIFL